MASSSDNGLESGRCCANIQTTHKSLYSAAAFINSKAGSHIGLIAHCPRSLLTDYVGRLIKKDCTIKLQARKTLRSRAPSEICHIIYIGACNNIIRNKLLYKSIHSHTQGSWQHSMHQCRPTCYLVGVSWLWDVAYFRYDNETKGAAPLQQFVAAGKPSRFLAADCRRGLHDGYCFHWEVFGLSLYKGPEKPLSMETALIWLADTQRRIQKIRNGGGATGGGLRQNQVLAVCTERCTGKSPPPPLSYHYGSELGGGPPPKSAPGYPWIAIEIAIHRGASTATQRFVAAPLRWRPSYEIVLFQPRSSIAVVEQCLECESMKNSQ